MKYSSLTIVVALIVSLVILVIAGWCLAVIINPTAPASSYGVLLGAMVWAAVWVGIGLVWYVKKGGLL